MIVCEQALLNIGVDGDTAPKGHPGHLENVNFHQRACGSPRDVAAYLERDAPPSSPSDESSEAADSLDANRGDGGDGTLSSSIPEEPAKSKGAASDGKRDNDGEGLATSISSLLETLVPAGRLETLQRSPFSRDPPSEGKPFAGAAPVDAAGGTVPPDIEAALAASPTLRRWRATAERPRLKMFDGGGLDDDAVADGLADLRRFGAALAAGRGEA